MLALFIGMIAAAIVGYLVGLIALRRTGIYFAMITVAIAEVFFFVEFNPLSDLTGGENGLPGVPTPTLRSRLHHRSFRHRLVALRVPRVLLLRRHRASRCASCARRSARSCSAIRDNPLRAAAVGHNIHGYKLTAFVIAAAYAGFAGGLLGVHAGLHAARRLHLRHLGPAGDADRDRRHRHAVRAAGRRRRSGSICSDFLQTTLHLGATWKLVLGIVFVLLVCFLRRGMIGGIKDLYGCLTALCGATQPRRRR